MAKTKRYYYRWKNKTPKQVKEAMQDLARKRAGKMTPEQRTAHGKKMIAARHKKQRATLQEKLNYAAR